MEPSKDNPLPGQAERPQRHLHAPCPAPCGGMRLDFRIPALSGALRYLTIDVTAAAGHGQRDAALQTHASCCRLCSSPISLREVGLRYLVLGLCREYGAMILGVLEASTIGAAGLLA